MEKFTVVFKMKNFGFRKDFNVFAINKENAIKTGQEKLENEGFCPSIWELVSVMTEEEFDNVIK